MTVQAALNVLLACVFCVGSWHTRMLGQYLLPWLLCVRVQDLWRTDNAAELPPITGIVNGWDDPRLFTLVGQCAVFVAK